MEMAVSTQFRVLKTLGAGGFGRVYLIQHRDWGSIACKELELYDDDKKEIRKEAAIHQHLRHPHIVTLYDVQFEPTCCRLFIEYMKYGTVGEFLKRYTVDWKWKLQIVHEIALAMAYLHGLRPAVIHGDLTCGNILIGPDFHAKVSDFGLAHIKGMSRKEDYDKLQGTIRYMDSNYLENPQRKKTEFFDVYGFAISVWEIFSEKTAYSGVDRKALITFIEKGTRPTLEDMGINTPEAIRNLTNQCWCAKVEYRPRFCKIKDILAEQIQLIQDELKPPIERTRNREQEDNSGTIAQERESLPTTASSYQRYHPSGERLLLYICKLMLMYLNAWKPIYLFI